MKTLKFSLGVTRMDRMRSTEHVRCFGDISREAKQRRFGLVQKRDSESMGSWMEDGFTWRQMSHCGHP